VETYLTKDGIKKLKDELDALYREKAEINKEVEETREQGDLSENAGYQYAKEKQNLIMIRISDIEKTLKEAKIVDETNVNKDEVRIGAKIKIFDLKTSEEKNYSLVSTPEADPANGKISVNSPLAEGLLGAKVGETVKVTLPNGIKNFKILSIDY
jgi:transcription elongation factor GreA